MKCIIFANGEYGDLKFYKNLLKEVDFVICSDGGANYAYMMGIIPDLIVGDLDSIQADVKKFMQQKNVDFKTFPTHKDFTDTQLAVSIAEEMGAKEIILLGTMGKRLDHTLSNLYCAMEAVERGIKIEHVSPECRVYIVNNILEIKGDRGDIVSVLPLTEEAKGVNERGFDYLLDNVILEKRNPYAVSNVISGSTAEISLNEGILLVIHYPKTSMKQNIIMEEKDWT